MAGEPRRTRQGRPGGKTENELIFIVEEAPEGGFTARALGESIFTEADDLAELHEQVRDAVRCHFDEDARPRIVRLHFVREEVLIV
ncbi:MAG: 2-oxoisovalerate dehydrogenase [Chloroflexi bacterium]|nr:2-oxoisovalerate dehydrogenase [Chloroflexota bacterium]